MEFSGKSLQYSELEPGRRKFRSLQDWPDIWPSLTAIRPQLSFPLMRVSNSGNFASTAQGFDL